MPKNNGIAAYSKVNSQEFSAHARNRLSIGQENVQLGKIACGVAHHLARWNQKMDPGSDYMHITRAIHAMNDNGPSSRDPDREICRSGIKRSNSRVAPGD